MTQKEIAWMKITKQIEKAKENGILSLVEKYEKQLMKLDDLD